MINFFIGIPTINRADLLNDALKKYIVDFPSTKILIMDNGNQNIFQDSKNIFVFKADENMGVASSWNWLIKKGFGLGYSYAFILNDDIYFGKKEYEVQEYINLHKDNGFMVGKDINWSSFIISKHTIKKIGWFDENFFPAYYEDNDFCYRMQLAGITRDQSYFLNPKIYRNSMTIIKAPSLNANFENNRQYFIKKWGGEPTKEKFKTPFNQ